MKREIYYLQGPGTRSDAAFEVLGNRVRVVAERGWANCWNGTVTREFARAMWQLLKDQGWVRTNTPRRTIEQIDRDIRD